MTTDITREWLDPWGASQCDEYAPHSHTDVINLRAAEGHPRKRNGNACNTQNRDVTCNVMQCDVNLT